MATRRAGVGRNDVLLDYIVALAEGEVDAVLRMSGFQSVDRFEWSFQAPPIGFCPPIALCQSTCKAFKEGRRKFGALGVCQALGWPSGGWAVSACTSATTLILLRTLLEKSSVSYGMVKE